MANLDVDVYTQGRRNRWALRKNCPLKGGAQVPLHNSIISNFMIYQDRLETNLLQLFAPTCSSEWFSIISVICFEASIVSEHINTKRITVLGALLH